ncbi:hypothetical protein [Corynebacterium bovis]|uniref:hypothetical protein n=1 Tax=Corynebacterium bovis TaxID=36808 RepID=UPI00313A05B9
MPARTVTDDDRLRIVANRAPVTSRPRQPRDDPSLGSPAGPASPPPSPVTPTGRTHPDAQPDLGLLPRPP